MALPCFRGRARRTSPSSPAISPCCCAPAPESTRRWSCSPPTPILAACGSTATKMTSAILAGESFADAISHHPSVFPADLCRARPRGRGVGKSGADPRGDQRGASARRGLASASVRHLAIPGVSFVGGRRRAAVFPPCRFAAVRQRVSRLQRETGSGSGDLSRHFGFPAQGHEYSSRRPRVPAVSRPSPVSAAGGPRRA